MKKLFITILLGISTAALAQQTEHQVKRGETFASIAAKYGITEDALRKANADRKTAFAGMKLRIPKVENSTSVNTKVAVSQQPPVQKVAVRKEEAPVQNLAQEQIVNEGDNNDYQNTPEDERAAKKARRKARWKALGKIFSGIGKTLVSVVDGATAAKETKDGGGSTLDAINSGLSAYNESFGNSEILKSKSSKYDKVSYSRKDSQTSNIEDMENRLSQLRKEYGALEEQKREIKSKAKESNIVRSERLRTMSRQRLENKHSKSRYVLTKEEEDLLKQNKETYQWSKSKEHEIVLRQSEVHREICRLEEEIKKADREMRYEQAEDVETKREIEEEEEADEAKKKEKWKNWEAYKQYKEKYDDGVKALEKVRKVVCKKVKFKPLSRTSSSYINKYTGAIKQIKTSLKEIRNKCKKETGKDLWINPIEDWIWDYNEYVVYAEDGW